MIIEDKYKVFLDNLFKDTPDFMKLQEEDDEYMILDRLVLSLNDNAMPWLFKVYLENQYKILKNDKFTMYIRNKYPNLKLNLINFNGNLFFDINGLYIILKELENNNQISFIDSEKIFILN